MDQVFDFREFILMLFKKSKAVLICLVIFAILGGLFGFVRFNTTDRFRATTSASVNFNESVTESSALTNAMTNITATITSDFFYTEVLNKLKLGLTESELSELTSNISAPKISDLKEIINIYTKGNLVLIEVLSENEQLSNKASRMGMNYISEKIQGFIDNVIIKDQGQQTINLALQDGGSTLKSIIKFAVLGMGGGIVLGILLIFFVEIFDLKVKSSEDLKKYKLPVLGEIQ